MDKTHRHVNLRIEINEAGQHEWIREKVTILNSTVITIVRLSWEFGKIYRRSDKSFGMFKIRGGVQFPLVPCVLWRKDTQSQHVCVAWYISPQQQRGFCFWGKQKTRAEIQAGHVNYTSVRRDAHAREEFRGGGRRRNTISSLRRKRARDDGTARFYRAA